MSHYLAINPGGIQDTIQGEAATDPAFGLPAVWITEDQREEAERLGYTVVDPPSIIATHLTEIIKRHASEILGRQEVQATLDALKTDYPAVVEDVTKSLSIGVVQKVLQGLLREQISVRNLVTILETLADYAGVTQDVGFLTERARQSLSRQISIQHSDEGRRMRVLTLDPTLEQKIIESKVDTAGGSVSAMEPAEQRRWINALSESVKAAQEQGYMPIVLCSETARPLVKSSSSREIRHLVVLSAAEIDPEVSVESIGQIKVEG